MANIGNGSLRWESTSKLTAGIEMILLDNKLSLAANMFKSNTDNLLSVGALSYVTGLPDTWSNGGSLSNTGFSKQVFVPRWQAGPSGSTNTSSVSLSQSAVMETMC